MTARSPPLQVSLRIPLLAAAVVFLFVTAMNQMALRLHKAVARWSQT